MDYTKLAADMLKSTYLLHRAREQKQVNELMKGGSFIIQFLYESGGSVLPNEISSAMMISTARVAAALNNLEDKGFITRRIDKTDRRRILVSLTEEGKAAAEEQHHAVLHGVAQMLGLLGEDDAREFVRIMGRLGELLNNAECV